MAETRDRGSVFATEEGIQILKDAKAAKRNYNGKPWTYQDIAIESGLDPKTVGRFFRFRQRIDESSALVICQALGVDYSQVVEIRFSVGTAAKRDHGIDWREICVRPLSEWKRLTTNDLTAGNGVRFQLDDVFVPLGLVERRQRPRHSPISSSPEQGSELYEEKVTPISQHDFFEQVLRQRQSKNSQGSRIAIIGEPGAGKTTQLQKIGDWILKETDGIPIWIPLAAVGTRTLKEYLLHDWLQTATSEPEVPQQYRDELGQLLKTGKVWLLLDGVDEMAVSDALHQISVQMREGWLQNVRVVLTCRLNVWDAGKQFLDRFDVFRNLDFDYPTEVHQFIDKCFAAEPELQQKLKVALEQPGKERIRDMVKNPLRLTLLCYSWQLRQGELPETKAELYEWFVDVFYKWNKGKTSIKLTATKRKELNQALGELAREAIDQESSRFRLREKFVVQFLGDADDEESLFYLALQLGWLNRVGIAEENPLEDVYAFFHPTFQEYFAALAIDDWHYFLNHNPHNLDVGVYRIFEPQWEETILLWFGGAEKSRLKEDFLNAMINLDDECDNFYYYRAYSIAAASTSEFSDYSRTAEVIDKVVRWSFCSSKDEPHSWHTSPLQEQARILLNRTNPVKTVDSLKGLIQANPVENLPISKINQLKALHQSGEAVLAYHKFLDGLSNSSLNTNIEELQSEVLDQCEILFEISALILQHDFLCIEIIEVLNQISPQNSIIFETLNKVLKHCWDKFPLEDFQQVLFSAAKTLEIVYPGNSKTPQILLEMLISTNNPDSQNNGFSHLALEIELFLEEIGKNNSIAIESLTHLLKLEQDSKTYRKAAEILGKIAFGNLETVQLLVLLIESCHDKERKLILAQCLGKLDSNHSIFVSTIVEILRSLDLESCYKAIDAIAREQQSINPTILRELVRFVETAQKRLSKIYSNRISAKDNSALQEYKFLEESCALASDLITDDQTEETIDITILEKLLDTIQDDWCLITIAKNLWKVSPSHEKAQEIFDRFLSKASGSRFDAAWSLISTFPNHPKASITLHELIREEHNFDIIDIYFETGFSEKHYLDVISILQELLESEEAAVRFLAAENLTRIDFIQPRIVRVLVDLIDSPKECFKALFVLKELSRNSCISDGKIVFDLIHKLINPLNFNYQEKDEFQLVMHCTAYLIMQNCPNNLLWFVVSSLRQYLKEPANEYESVRYRSCYQVIWHCAQNMSYQDFHHAWHSNSFIGV